MPGKTNYIWEVTLVSQSAPFLTDLPTALHPIHTVPTPRDWGLFFKVYSFRSSLFCTNRVTSHRMWLFTTHRPSSRLPSLENSQQTASGRCYHPLATCRSWHNPALPLTPTDSVPGSIYIVTSQDSDSVSQQRTINCHNLGVDICHL